MPFRKRNRRSPRRGFQLTRAVGVCSVWLVVLFLGGLLSPVCPRVTHTHARARLSVCACVRTRKARWRSRFFFDPHFRAVLLGVACWRCPFGRGGYLAMHPFSLQPYYTVALLLFRGGARLFRSRALADFGPRLGFVACTVPPCGAASPSFPGSYLPNDLVPECRCV